MSIEQPVSSGVLGDSPAASSRVEVQSGHLASGWVMGVTFAVIGSLLAWGLLQALYPVFAVPSELTSIEQPNAQQMDQLRAAELRTGRSNAVLVLGWAGLLLAGGMAVGEGLARRSWMMMVTGFIGCGLLGALFGGLAGWVGHLVYQSAKLPHELTIDLEGTVVVQMTMLAVLGGGVGLALGGLTGRAGSTFTRLLGGVLAGIFAGMLYPVVAAWFLPAVQTEHLIPRDGTGSLLWLGLTAVFLGLVVPEMKLRRTRKKPSPSAPQPAMEEIPPADVSEEIPSEEAAEGMLLDAPVEHVPLDDEAPSPGDADEASRSAT